MWCLNPFARRAHIVIPIYRKNCGAPFPVVSSATFVRAHENSSRARGRNTSPCCRRSFLGLGASGTATPALRSSKEWSQNETPEALRGQNMRPVPKGLGAQQDRAGHG